MRSDSAIASDTNRALDAYTLDYATPLDSLLQEKVQTLDARLRERYGMTRHETALGVLDLKRLRLAMVDPDRIEYGASVPKVGILLAWFQLHPAAAGHLEAATRHELGLMIKASSNEMAAKYSRELGLRQIQQVLDSYHLYDINHEGGIWVGKHYGQGDERRGDPIANHSHAVTVRQLLRFYRCLEQGKLVSPEASKVMREIFASPEIPHEQNKFVKGLAGRDLQILRKSGSWENWFHDTAVVSGPGRHYIVVGLTQHPKGDEYLVELGRAVDDLLKPQD
jgi:beta-lactamase class A